MATTTITQVGIVVQDIEAKARAWAGVLGLPVPEIIITDTQQLGAILELLEHDWPARMQRRGSWR